MSKAHELPLRQRSGRVNAIRTTPRRHSPVAGRRRRLVEVLARRDFVQRGSGGDGGSPPAAPPDRCSAQASGYSSPLFAGFGGAMGRRPPSPSPRRCSGHFCVNPATTTTIPIRPTRSAPRGRRDSDGSAMASNGCRRSSCRGCAGRPPGVLEVRADAAGLAAEDVEPLHPTVRQVLIQRGVVEGGDHLGDGGPGIGPLTTAVQVSFLPGSSLEVKCSHLTVASCWTTAHPRRGSPIGAVLADVGDEHRESAAHRFGDA